MQEHLKYFPGQLVRKFFRKESMIDIPFDYKVTETLVRQRTRLKVKNKITGKIGEISQRYWETIIRNGHEKDFELLEKK